jgi:UDP-N-acetyl-D-glucosamine dehydrogenase
MTTMTTPAQQPVSMSDAARQLKERIENKTAVIGILGLGYVGLPLARAVHDAGYPVLGFDVDQTKVDALERGENYLQHLGDELTQALAVSDRFEATANAEALGKADVILLCVPTPLGEHREPDLSFVLDSTELAANALRPGQLIVLESTTYPGTTRQEMLPILEKSGLKHGEHFFVAYSPEREDPGRKDATTATIPKLVGGLDEVSGDLAMSFYSRVIKQAHPVSSAEVAESAKLLENIYRAVNIALVNELKVVLARMGIDVWEVIDGAKTKPFGFQAFYPGPGLGGHCIPIDPFYLTWKAKELGLSTKFIELAGEVNAQMPAYVISVVMDALNHDRKSLNGSKVLVIGLSYKPDIDDVRESPAAEVIDLLHEHGAEVSYHDPHVPTFPPMRRYQFDMRSVELTEDRLKDTDCVLIITDHAKVDYALIGAHAPLVVDSRNAMAKMGGEGITARVVKA